VVAEGKPDCAGADVRGVTEGKIKRARAVRIIFVRILDSPLRAIVGRE